MRGFIISGSGTGSVKFKHHHLIGALTYIGLHHSVDLIQKFKIDEIAVKSMINEVPYSAERLLPHFELMIWYAKTGLKQRRHANLTRFFMYSLIWRTGVYILSEDTEHGCKVLRGLSKESLA